MTDGAMQNVVLQLTETADKLAGLERLIPNRWASRSGSPGVRTATSIHRLGACW